MTQEFSCWSCGSPLDGLILPMSRREECHRCGADQHVCKMCVHFTDSGRGQCQEERAEWIADREKANFCDYFKPTLVASAANKIDKSAAAKAKLAELFGDEPSQPDSSKKDEALTPSELAEKKLREMLGG